MLSEVKHYLVPDIFGQIWEAPWYGKNACLVRGFGTGPGGAKLVHRLGLSTGGEADHDQAFCVQALGAGARIFLAVRQGEHQVLIAAGHGAVGTLLPDGQPVENMALQTGRGVAGHHPPLAICLRATRMLIRQVLLRCAGW